MSAAFVIASLMSLNASAILRNELIKQDMSCWNELRSLRISQDFSLATLTEGGQSRDLKINVSHMSGGFDQAVIFTISGLDGLHVTSTLVDRFKLDGGGRGQVVRSRQAGYGNTTIETFECKYGE
jgi:hypothetical protein